MDEELLREYADEIKDYCSTHKDKCVGCIFYRTYRIGEKVVEGECILRSEDPENWKL